MPEREGIHRSKKLGDEASPGQPDRRSPPSQEAEATVPAVAEQSVLEPVTTAVAEGRPRGGLIALLSRISTDPLAVHDAWEDLRSMIEEVVGREIRALEKRIGTEIRAVETRVMSELKSLRAEFVMMRWVLGSIAAMNIAMLAMLVTMFIFLVNDRMDSRPEVNPVEQTRGATLPAAGNVVADEQPASVSASDLGIDTEPAGPPPAEEGSPSTADTW